MIISPPSPHSNDEQFRLETSRAIAQLASVKLGTDAAPTFKGLTVSGTTTLSALTADQLVYANASKALASAAVSTGLDWTAPTLKTKDSEIVHDNLSGFVANEHIDHTAVSISAGGILSGGGDISANRIISLAHGDVDHDQTLNFVADEHVAHSGVSISGGGILSGGGDISASRTISLAHGDVDHDQTANYAADKHVAHSGVSISGGGILSGGGDITANRTISLAHGDVDHDQTANYVADKHVAHSDVTLTAGNGLTGGGTIAANRTFALDSSYSPTFAGGIYSGLLQLTGECGNEAGNLYVNCADINTAGRVTSGVYILAPDRAVDVDETNYIIGLRTQMADANIANTKTDSGYHCAIRGAAYINDPDFEGTLSTLMGMWFQVGTFNNGTGTVTDCYGIKLDHLSSGGTITNMWGMYQSTAAAKNYFAGNCAFGVATPLEDVHAGDTVRADVAFNLNGTDGWSGTFTNGDGDTVTVSGGIITGVA